MDYTVTLFVSFGVRVILARTPDQRVEFFGQLDLGIGRLFQDATLPPGVYVLEGFLLVPAIGPGVRYWFHPQVAISASLLFRARLLWFYDRDVFWTELGLLGSLQLTAVF
jgi:hypothetical protein